MNCKICDKIIIPDLEQYCIYYTEPQMYTCWICSLVDKYREYTKDRQLSTKILIDANMYNYYITECNTDRLLKLNPNWLYEMAKYGEVLREIHSVFTPFIETLKESPVFASWLSFNVPKCKDWGSASFKNTEFSIYLKSCAGRTLITFSNPLCDFTIIGADDSSYLSTWGWQGVYGKINDLYILMTNVLRIFPELRKDDTVFIV